MGDELDEAAHAKQAHRQEDQAGETAGDHQPLHTVGSGDRRQQHDERSGGTGDRVHRSTGQGDDGAGDDRREQAMLGRSPGGDGQGHGQGEGDETQGEPGDGVGAQVAPVVTASTNRSQSGGEAHRGLIGHESLRHRVTLTGRRTGQTHVDDVVSAQCCG